MEVIGAWIDALWSPGPILAVQHLFGPGWDPVFLALTLLGSQQAAVLAIALVFWLRGRWLAYAVLGVVILGALVNTTLKDLVDLPRPHDPRIDIHVHQRTPSFPSGHSETAATLWGALVSFGRISILIPLVIVPAVMLSRLYLGVHYLGDVLGGALLGLLLLAGYRHLWPVIARWFAGRSFAFVMALGLLAPLVALPFAPTEHGWDMFGAVLGAGIALPLEYRLVRFIPVSLPGGRQLLKLAIGLVGLAVLTLVHVLLGGRGVVVTTGIYALAAVWVALLAPVLFIRLGFARSGVGNG